MRRVKWKSIPWDPVDILLYGILLLLAFAGLILLARLVVATGLLATLGDALGIPPLHPLVGIVFIALIQAAVMVALVLVICFVKNQGTWIDLGFGVPVSKTWLYGVMGGIGLLALAMVFGFLVSQVVEEVPAQGITEQFARYRDFTGIASLFFVVVILAPISEELVFRGFIYGALRKRGGLVMAGVISSLAFTAIHLQFHWVLFLQIFLLGFVLAWIYERSRNIIAPIIAHGVYNLAIALVLISS